jgi:hypothetical protein
MVFPTVCIHRYDGGLSEHNTHILPLCVCTLHHKAGFDMKTQYGLVDLLRSPGIDSQPGGPVRQPYLTYRPARLHKLAESIPGLYKRLQIRALYCICTTGVQKK